MFKNFENTFSKALKFFSESFNLTSEDKLKHIYIEKQNLINQIKTIRKNARPEEIAIDYLALNGLITIKDPINRVYESDTRKVLIAEIGNTWVVRSKPK